MSMCQKAGCKNIAAAERMFMRRVMFLCPRCVGVAQDDEPCELMTAFAVAHYSLNAAMHAGRVERCGELAKEYSKIDRECAAFARDWLNTPLPGEDAADD